MNSVRRLTYWPFPTAISTTVLKSSSVLRAAYSVQMAGLI